MPQSEETTGLFQLSSLEESLEWLEKVDSGSSFEQQFAQCILMAHRLGVHYWHIISGGRYGCCLDFSISALCCIRLLLFAAPSSSQLSSQLPPGTLSYSVASWFQSNKSVYFSLLSFRSFAKCCPIAAQGTDTVSNSSNCQWRWPPMSCQVGPGSTQSWSHLTSPSVEQVPNTVPQMAEWSNICLIWKAEWVSSPTTEPLQLSSWDPPHVGIVHPSVHTTKGVD